MTPASGAPPPPESRSESHAAPVVYAPGELTGRVVRGTVDVVRKHPLPVAALFILAYGPSLFSVLLRTATYRYPWYFYEHRAVYHSAYGLAAIALLGSVAIAFASPAACAQLVFDSHDGVGVSFRRSLGAGFRTLWSVVWADTISWAVILVGALLAVIPGIYALLATSLVVPALVREDLRGARAIRRSFELVRTHLAAVVPLLVVLNAALMASQIPYLSAAYHEYVLKERAAPPGSGGWQEFAVDATCAIVPLFAAIATAVLYAELCAHHSARTRASLEAVFE